MLQLSCVNMEGDCKGQNPWLNPTDVVLKSWVTVGGMVASSFVLCLRAAGSNSGCERPLLLIGVVCGVARSSSLAAYCGRWVQAEPVSLTKSVQFTGGTSALQTASKWCRNSSFEELPSPWRVPSFCSSVSFSGPSVLRDFGVMVLTHLVTVPSFLQ